VNPEVARRLATNNVWYLSGNEVPLESLTGKQRLLARIRRRRCSEEGPDGPPRLKDRFGAVAMQGLAGPGGANRQRAAIKLDESEN
jgi:hypothetical protein